MEQLNSFIKLRDPMDLVVIQVGPWNEWSINGNLPVSEEISLKMIFGIRLSRSQVSINSIRLRVSVIPLTLSLIHFKTISAESWIPLPLARQRIDNPSHSSISSCQATTDQKAVLPMGLHLPVFKPPSILSLLITQ